MPSDKNLDAAKLSLNRRAMLGGLMLPAAAFLLGGCARGLKVAAGSDVNSELNKDAVSGLEIPEGVGSFVVRRDGTRAFRNHKLVDQDGKVAYFQQDLVEGQVFAATFQYAKCNGICGSMTSRMAETYDLLKPIMNNPVKFYMFSLAEDSPAEMKQFMVDHGIYGRPGWRYFSASRETIKDIRWAFGFGDPNEEVDSSLSGHTGMARFCYHKNDRWAACAALAAPRMTAQAMIAMFPADQRPKIAGLERPQEGNTQPIPGYKPRAPLNAETL
jgi:protein SCO1/2